MEQSAMCISYGTACRRMQDYPLILLMFSTGKCILVCICYSHPGHFFSLVDRIRVMSIRK